MSDEKMMPTDVERPSNWPLQSFDATDWAGEFMRLFGDEREQIDEALMLAWFANVLMRGYDEHAWRNTAALAHPPQARDVAEVQRLHDEAVSAAGYAGSNIMSDCYGRLNEEAKTKSAAFRQALAALPPVDAGGDDIQGVCPRGWRDLPAAFTAVAVPTDAVELQRLHDAAVSARARRAVAAIDGTSSGGLTALCIDHDRAEAAFTAALPLRAPVDAGNSGEWNHIARLHLAAEIRAWDDKAEQLSATDINSIVNRIANRWPDHFRPLPARPAAQGERK